MRFLNRVEMNSLLNYVHVSLSGKTLVCGTSELGFDSQTWPQKKYWGFGKRLKPLVFGASIPRFES